MQIKFKVQFAGTYDAEQMFMKKSEIEVTMANDH
ncbi:hypothetical protein SDC9_168928 [bioreactor metagenome]|uniref:Uncharacterized protein n=1 Tax=bioreactor metagenome TaxID=1076179 RepID=A0A645G3V9_9ZZZZ